MYRPTCASVQRYAYTLAVQIGYLYVQPMRTLQLDITVRNMQLMRR